MQILCAPDFDSVLNHLSAGVQMILVPTGINAGPDHFIICLKNTALYYHDAIFLFIVIDDAAKVLLQLCGDRLKRKISFFKFVPCFECIHQKYFRCRRNRYSPDIIGTESPGLSITMG
jgi:hypothetical protein